MTTPTLPPEVALLVATAKAHARNAARLPYDPGPRALQLENAEAAIDQLGALAHLSASASAAAQGEAVPAGFWLAPMEADQDMRLAPNKRWDMTTTWRAMRDSWLSRHPAPPASASAPRAQPAAASAAVREHVETAYRLVFEGYSRPRDYYSIDHDYIVFLRDKLTKAHGILQRAIGVAQAAPVDALPELPEEDAWLVTEGVDVGVGMDRESRLSWDWVEGAECEQLFTLTRLRTYARVAQALVRATPATTLELPHPGGAEISALLDSILHEYNWPSNPKNAARAGWTAAMRYLRSATPRVEVQPLTEERRLRAVEEHCWDVRCIDLPTGAGDADVGWQVIEHYEAKPHERVRGAMWARTPGEAIDAAIAHVAGDLAIARRAHGIGTHREADKEQGNG